MEFEGVVFRKLPEVTGTSAKGAWKKQDVVFELPGEFSRKVCVTFFGDRVDDAARLQEGDSAQVSVNVESREYNGKWYTDVKAWKITPRGSSAGMGPNTAATQNAAAVSDAPFNEAFAPANEELDDLPF